MCVCVCIYIHTNIHDQHRRLPTLCAFSNVQADVIFMKSTRQWCPFVVKKKLKYIQLLFLQHTKCFGIKMGIE